MLFRLLAIFLLPSAVFASDSATVSPPTTLNSTSPVHIIAVIETTTAFPDPGAGNEKLVGFALTGYVSRIIGPAVPNFYMSPGTTGSSPARNIIVPYTGNYRIGGQLIFFTARANPPTVNLTLQVVGVTAYPTSGNEFTPASAVGSRTVLDLGTYLNASNVTLTQGAQLYLWMWIGSPSDTGWLYILPGSYVTLDSIDQ